MNMAAVSQTLAQNTNGVDNLNKRKSQYLRPAVEEPINMNTHDKSSPNKKLDNDTDAKLGSNSTFSNGDVYRETATINNKSHPHLASSKQNMLSSIRLLVLPVVLGLLFGFLLNKSTVFVAPTIRLQMLFQRYAMLKMFLAAVGTSMLSVSALLICCEQSYKRVLRSYIEQNASRLFLHYVVGGTLIGLGMVVCGSCPGTVFVQLGAGIKNSLYTCLGACLGSFVYYAVIHTRTQKHKPNREDVMLKQLPDLIYVNRFIMTSILGIVFLGMAIGLEFIIPWKQDLNRSLLSHLDPEKQTGSVFGMAAWPPSVCGIGVGLLQLFFIFLLERSLGVSSAFTVFVAQLCRIPIFSRLVPELAKFTYGLKNATPLLFAIGAVSGSLLSSCLSQTFPLGKENGANIYNSILGGFFLLMGSRIAGGCTSGQGISGVTHLLVGSFVATAAMFGGGILFAITYSFAKVDLASGTL